MTDPEMLSWLRATIERDLSSANLVSAGGFAPQRWDTDPPGQVNPEEIPASRQVTEIIGADHDEVCGWVQIVAYDRLNNEPPEADCRDSAAPVILVDNGRREFEHVIRNDPRNVVARCEAELAILDEHGPYTGPLPRMSGCKTCMREEGDNFWPCRTLSLLAAGYRHRPGWKTEWAA